MEQQRLGLKLFCGRDEIREEDGCHISFHSLKLQAYGTHLHQKTEGAKEEAFIFISQKDHHRKVTRSLSEAAVITEERQGLPRNGRLFQHSLLSLIVPTAWAGNNFHAMLSWVNIFPETRLCLQQELSSFGCEMARKAYEEGYQRLEVITQVEELITEVCERSLSNTQGGPSMAPVQHFERANMLPSGYLIRPCEGDGLIIRIVDHMNLEPWNVPEVLCPLYESSTMLAQKTTMAPRSDSIGIVDISHGCIGVAARACDHVGLEPIKVAEILKDRTSWFHECKSVDVINVLPTTNGGTIELLYMQLYAPTTLAPARDFSWLLRYSSILGDGSLVVCERSLSSIQGGPSMPLLQHFGRANMLPSGYLIRPYEGDGLIIHIVDHMDLEPWSVPEVLHPLYESSTVLAQKTTMAECFLPRPIFLD